MNRFLRLIPVLIVAAGAMALGGCEFNLTKSGGPTTTVQQPAVPVGGDALKQAAVDLNNEAVQIIDALTAAVNDGRVSKAQFASISAAKADVDRSLDEAGAKARDTAKLEEEARGALNRSRAEISRLRAVLTAAPPAPGEARSAPIPITPTLPKAGG